MSLWKQKVYGKFVWHKPNAYTLYDKNFNVFTKLKQGFTILGEKFPQYILTNNSRNSDWSSWKINTKKTSLDDTVHTLRGALISFLIISD